MTKPSREQDVHQQQDNHRRRGDSGALYVVEIRPGDDQWQNVTFLSHSKTGEGYQTKPCSQCPWVVDNPTGRFPEQVFRNSARTAYDMSEVRFGCHMSPKDEPLTCAGFVLNGAKHNMSVRMYGPDTSAVSDGGRRLYRSYRTMAEANGVDPDDPALAPCRDPRPAGTRYAAQEDHPSG